MPSNSRYYQLHDITNPPTSLTGLATSDRAPKVRMSQGIAGRKSRLIWNDVYIITLQLICLGLATATVFESRVAIILGQTNQLIAVGFLLAIMALLLDNQVKRTALVCAGNCSSTTIQDIDALIRRDILASRVHWCYRILLLLLLGFPIGLSVGYKTFIGGHTTIISESPDGIFGFASTPGKQRIADGLSLVSDIYVPFWISPAIAKVYGSNLYIIDNNTAMIVDTPFPTYLTRLQSSLQGRDVFSLTAVVNATVAEMVNPTPEQRANESYWQIVGDEYASSPAIGGNDIQGANNAFWSGTHSHAFQNWTVMFCAAWNETSNETFESEAIRVEHTRQTARATWLIDHSSITLTEAQLLDNVARPDQSIIQDSSLSLQAIFSSFIGEYDWHNRAGAFDFPYPSLPNETIRYYQPVNTVPALTASILWARVTSLDTTDRPQGIQSAQARSITGYTKSANEIFLEKTVSSLSRSPFLLAILLINPLLTLVATTIKMLLYRTPIGDNFNIIAMLAASQDSELQTLRGAALTGELTRRVRVGFRIVESFKQESLGGPRIVMSLDKIERGGQLDRGVAYS